jgi:ABC-type antimicrobial peptide transport system permease subunit
VRTLEQMLETEAFDRATMTALLNTFAFVGLILAALGVYGVIRHAVEHRTHEIAVRMGLGARAADVVRMIVAQGARLAAIGIAIGLFGAWGLTRVMASMLDTPRPADPIVIGAMVLMIALVALLTSWWPALRVTRIQPMDALRTD